MRTVTKIYLLLTCLLFTMLCMYVLNVYANAMRARKGNFIRWVPPHSLEYVKDVLLPDGSYYFAGQTDSALYISSQTSPNLLWSIDTALLRPAPLQLQLPDTTRFFSLQTAVSGGRSIYLFDGSQSLIMTTQLPSLFLKQMTINPGSFYKAVPIRRNSFALQSYDSSLHQNVYKKYDANGAAFDTVTYAPQAKGDGVFSIDGMLLQNKNKMVFVYYYRNRFDCLDSNLRLSFTGTTIDTTQQVNLLLSQTTPNSTRLASLPSPINISACMADDRLYLRSGSFAKNETRKVLYENAVIDIYSLTDGRYIQSLYAPVFRNKPLQGFRVVSNHFYGLYGRYLACFRIKRTRSEEQLSNP